MRSDVCGEKVHGFLLQRASGTRTFVWGWEIRARHVNDLTENLTSLYEALAEGLLNIPDYLDWDIHLGDEATSHDLTQPNKDTLPSKVSEQCFMKTISFTNQKTH